MGARYYDPRSGRFLSPDPVGHPLCLDLYAYAGGDAINYFDPDGRFLVLAYLANKPTVLGTTNFLDRAGGILLGFGDFLKSKISGCVLFGQYASNDFLDYNFSPHQKAYILAARDSYLSGVQENIEQYLTSLFTFDSQSSTAHSYRKGANIGLNILDFFRGNLISPSSIMSFSKPKLIQTEKILFGQKQ